MKIADYTIIALLVSALVSGCKNVPEHNAGEHLRIVCTTGMIGDAVARIAADKAEVHVLMGPGVDPHLYKATQGDLRILAKADVIFYNGLHLEGKMGEVLHKLSRTKKVIALGDSLPKDKLLHPASDAKAFDPHVWFDVSLWAEVVRRAGRTLAAVHPGHSDLFLRNASTYASALDSLHLWVKEQMAMVPRERRVLITAHDAFGYFGKAYDVEVHGLQGISTASEYGLRDVSNLVRFLSERQVKAVFVESSVPTKSMEAVIEGCASRGHTVAIGGSLYSDAMGDAGTPEGTYTGMVRANVETILKGIR